MKRLLVIALLVAGCSQSSAPVAVTIVPNVAPDSTADLVGSEAPSPGEIRFGSAFDTTTYGIEGRLMKGSLADEIAIDAHFTKTAAQDMTFQILHGADVRHKETVPLGSPIDLYDVVISSGDYVTAGTYTIRFRHAGGTTLASGKITLTE